MTISTNTNPNRRKAVYQQYTDTSFTVKNTRPANWQHLGFLGPVIRAEATS